MDKPSAVPPAPTAPTASVFHEPVIPIVARAPGTPSMPGCTRAPTEKEPSAATTTTEGGKRATGARAYQARTANRAHRVRVAARAARVAKSVATANRAAVNRTPAPNRTAAAIRDRYRLDRYRGEPWAQQIPIPPCARQLFDEQQGSSDNRSAAQADYSPVMPKAEPWELKIPVSPRVYWLLVDQHGWPEDEFERTFRAMDRSEEAAAAAAGDVRCSACLELQFFEPDEAGGPCHVCSEWNARAP